MNFFIIILFFILLLICSCILVLSNLNSNLNSNLHSNLHKIKSIKGGTNQYNNNDNNNNNNDNIWLENVKISSDLLKTTFKGLYTADEEKLILKTCSSVIKEINPWNDLIDLIPYYNNFFKLGSNLLRYPQKFLTHSSYFRKFFIARLQILTRFCSLKQNSTIVYICAEHSNFLPFLIQLFPHCIWNIYHNLPLTYSLNSTNLNSTNLNSTNSTKIKIINEEFTINTASEWVNKCDIVISDFRRPPPKGNKLSENEDKGLLEIFDKQMLEDIYEQSAIIKKIQPKIGASIKFKLPFVDPTDISTIKIIRGKILWLPWSSPSSTDGTLLIEAADARSDSPDMDINLKQYQDSYATHNKIYRCWGYYTMPDELMDNVKPIGYDNCFDCTCEYFAWSEYKKNNHSNHSCSTYMNNLGQFLAEPLISIVNKQDYHGRFPNDLPATRILKISKLEYVGVQANTDVLKIKNYAEKLKLFADKYDEFTADEDIVVSTFEDIISKNNDKHNNDKKSNGIFTNAVTYVMPSLKSDNIFTNAVTNKLLATKFHNMYTPREQKVILAVSSKIQKLPNIWNNFKSIIKYRGNKGGKLANNLVYCHLGQRKLFMTELQVLTRFLGQHLQGATTPCIIVYAGAAPGIHLPLLFKLFPNTMWHLYDPAPFKIMGHTHHNNNNEKKQYKTYNDYFTDDVARSWTNKCDIFICDIRLSADDSNKFEIQVANDMKTQDTWTRIIQPKMGASLKFRPPYIEQDKSLQIVNYLRGQILWQIWPPQASTECRLIVEGVDATMNAPSMEFDVAKYQDSCAAHNMIDRAWKTYALPCNGLEKVIGYDRCFDCTCEAMSWIAYNKLPNARVKPVNELMDSLTAVTNQSLKNKKSFHGFNQYQPACIRLSMI